MPAEPGVWDELREADGALRPVWRRFADAMPSPAGGDLAADLDRRVVQVAERILNYVSTVGHERVIAGVDCGLAYSIDPPIVSVDVNAG